MAGISPDQSVGMSRCDYSWPSVLQCYPSLDKSLRYAQLDSTMDLATQVTKGVLNDKGMLLS
jgi:hypothetical protein